MVAPYTGAWLETRALWGQSDDGSVAPYTGAWIETPPKRHKDYADLSHPTRVRGLKLRCSYYSISPSCRTLHGCVDWNQALSEAKAETGGRTLHGCVDWNESSRTKSIQASRRTLHGCVDWNIKTTLIFTKVKVAPYTGAWIETTTAGRRAGTTPVAPYMGAWIETWFHIFPVSVCCAYSTRVRGRYRLPSPP